MNGHWLENQSALHQYTVVQAVSKADDLKQHLPLPGAIELHKEN